MGKSKWLACTALSAVVMLAGSAAYAAAGGPSNAELEQRIQRLEDKLAQQPQSDSGLRSRVSTLEQRASEVEWRYDNGRPRVLSGDGRFELALRARFHLDAASFMQDDDLIPAISQPNRDLGSGAVVRRAQIGVEGKVFNDYWYEFRLNFGGSSVEDPGTASANTTTTICSAVAVDATPGTDGCPAGSDAVSVVNSVTNSSVGDANVNLMRVMYTGIPGFRINAGVIQPILTAEDSTSSNEITFIERAAVVNAFVDGFGGSDSRRGIELTYQKENSFYPGSNIVLSAAYTGQRTSTARPRDEGTYAIGRVAYRLWSDGTSNIQIGASGSTVLSLNGGAPGSARNITIQDRPEIRVDGTQLVSTGGIASEGADVYGFDFGMNLRNFYLAGEWYNFTLDRPGATPDADFDGYYVAGSWVITGQNKGYAASSNSNNVAAFGTPVVVTPFSLKGGSLGAIELAARYSTLNLNDNEGIEGAPTPAGGIRGGEQNIWTIGVNWYLNRNVRVMVNYLDVDVDRLSGSGTQVGQEFGVVAGRLQFAF